ncbi:MAG: RNA polymerase sigma factor [Actinomycetota bacterium]
MTRPSPRNSPNQEADVRSDRDLVLDFQGGDYSAYAEIYRRYLPLIRSICMKLLGNADDAEEATQESMLRVFQALPDFNGSYHLKAWVARIATNVSLDELRARARRIVADIELEEQLLSSGYTGTGNGHKVVGGLNGHDRSESNGYELGPEEALEQATDGQEVRDALSALSERHRKALYMRAVEGRSHEEIAEALGTTPKRSKALIYRAKESFRRSWKEQAAAKIMGLLAPLLALLRWPRGGRRAVRLDEGARLTGASETSRAAGEVFSLGPHLQTAPFVPTAPHGFAQAAHLAESAGAAASQAASSLASAASQAAATVTQAASAAAAPAATSVIQSAGDKIVAGVTALVLAGSVGVATVTHRENRDPAEVQIVTAQQAPPVTSEQSPPVDPEAVQAGQETGDEDLGPTPAQGEQSQPADESPSPAPAPSPTGNGSPPNGNGEGTGRPAGPPPPAYSYGFRTSTPSESSCGCNTSPSVVYSQSDGRAGRLLIFEHQIEGAAFDAEGDAAWALDLRYRGSVSGSANGQVGISFTLTSDGRSITYQAGGSLASAYRTDGDGYQYTFVGDYHANDAAAAQQAQAPVRGGITLVVDFWSDGTSLIRTDVTMTEAEGD